MPQQRTALITGGAKRIGRAIAIRLADAGFAVAFTYNSSRDDANALMRDTGAMGIEADLSDPPLAVMQICDAFAGSFERLDVLVNNASSFTPASSSTNDLELSRRLMAIHFESPMLLCRSLEKILRASRGHVVNMLDAMVDRPMPKYAAYCASKAALANLTLSLARELAPEVTVNGIAPGVVDWPVEYPVAQREQYLKRVPLGRAGTPGDVAELVHFLATGGSYITGQIIRLDGGRSIM